ncbi:MAG TPA: MBL fold metallo-hydrolase [Bacteroides sp.]|mgnify:CR=1 FL=1|nr:MBL fold metallo-hydrolase [Bacteroides sp.]
MIKIHSMTFNSFQVNTYFVWDEAGDCLVVDPAFHTADEREHFDAFISSHNLRITGQVNTHCHVDHILGVHHLKSVYGQPFRAHPGEVPVAASAHRMGEIFGLKTEPLPIIESYIDDENRIAAGKYMLRALHVPGHSPGSLAFYSPEGRFVISGDALFAGSIGRTDLPGGDYEILIASIQSKLLVLPGDTAVYPGHGPSTSIGREARENPYFSMAE